MSRRKLDGAVVVITGASSGIGHAAALQFARRGAQLVLAARRQETLEEVARECVALGARALAVQTDTTDAAQVQRLADRAVAWCGRIDVWINNAGVAAFGSFLDTPLQAHDQVIRTNLMGYIHGAYAALPYFKRQRTGVLINLVSMAGWAPTPLASSYSASKFGNRGFGEALRVELAGEDIHVCDVFPAFVDTPMLEHVANYSGRVLKPVPPVIDTERVARTLVSLAERPRPSTPMGAAFPAAVGFHSGMPTVFRWFTGGAVKAYMRVAPSAGVTDGAVFQAAGEVGATTGHLRSPALRVTAGAAALGAVVLGAAWWLRRRHD